MTDAHILAHVLHNHNFHSSNLSLEIREPHIFHVSPQSFQQMQVYE